MSFSVSAYPDQALARSNAAIAEARRLAHPPSLALSLAPAARLLSLVGDHVALDERADQLVAVDDRAGFPLLACDGNDLSRLGEGQKWRCGGGDIASAQRFDRLPRHRGGKWMPYHIALLAKACEIAGQIEEAVTLLDDALQIVETTGERWLAAELNRHKGQLLLRQGHPEAAEELYRKALSIAEEQEAKLWELRAAASLARLRRDQGRRVEARDLLAPVYGWFNEGFDTADLKEAKALLDELA